MKHRGSNESERRNVKVRPCESNDYIVTNERAGCDVTANQRPHHIMVSCDNRSPG